MQEYRKYLKYSLKYAGIWNTMPIFRNVDHFSSDGPPIERLDRKIRHNNRKVTDAFFVPMVSENLYNHR